MARGILEGNSKPVFEFKDEAAVERPGIVVIDDFCRYPDRVRQSALAAGFGTWRPNKGEVGSSVYDGMCFWGDHALMIEPLVRYFGKPLAPNVMSFRVTNADTEAAYVHSDRESGEYTCIVYLSDHGDERTGTGFYRHRASGATRMKSFAEMSQNPEEFSMLKEQMVRGSEEDWELVKFVAGKYNRAVIFEAPLFHARCPKHGFADNMEDGRMVWATHFNVIR